MESYDNLKKEGIRLIRYGNTGQAVRLFQEHLNISSVDAERLVDSLMQEINATDAQQTTTTTSRNAAGCVVLGLRMIGILFGFFGLVMMIMAYVIYGEDYDPYEHSAVVNGTVIALEWDEIEGAVPVIEYTWEGRQYELTGTTYSNPPLYFDGDEVKLIMNTDNPAEAIIADTGDNTETAVIIVAFGIFFFVFAFAGIFSARKIESSFDKSV